MSRHRATRAPRHRAETGTGRGRLATLGGAFVLAVTVAVVATGLVPGEEDHARAVDPEGTVVARTPPEDPRAASGTGPAVRPAVRRSERIRRKAEPASAPADTALPPDSGNGRRVVFSEGRQRVWLVADGSDVVRTYPVSGSIYDNLDPGTYAVYSRSEEAVGIDDSGTMRYFVRFATGDRGAAIGFHDIPVKDGEPVQTVDQLGTPLSHGCVRQDRDDAVALWEFAPVGTTVVVTP